MNKIYRTVYNETTGTWVAVCEIAKTHTKSSGSTVDNATASVSGSLKARSLTAIAASLALLSPLAVSPAFAKPWDEGNRNDVTGSYSNASGQNNTVSGINSFASGKENTASGEYSTAVGDSNKAGGLNSVSLGGRNNQSTAHGSATLGGEYNDAGAEYSATVGGYENTATGRSAVAWGNTTFAGSMSADAAWLKQKYNPDGTLSEEATVIKACKDLGGTNSCIGLNPESSSNNTNKTLQGVIDYYNAENWTADDPTPFQTNYGTGVSGKGENATSWGLNTVAGNNQATAFGENSIANGVNSTAFGKESYAYADNSLAALGGQVGFDSQDAKNGAHSTTGVNSVAIGEKAWVRSDNAFALGKESLIDTGSANSVAIGSFSKVGPNATNSFAAVGGQAHNNNTIAIGVRSQAYGEGSLALGSGITSGNTAGAYSKGEGSIAIGKRAEAMGAKVHYDGDKGGVTLPQLSDEERKKRGLGDPTGHEYSYKRTEDSAYASQMIAIGDNASAYGNQSIAIGGNSVASGYASIAIGGDDIGNLKDDSPTKTLTDYLASGLNGDLTEEKGFTVPSTIKNLNEGKPWVNLTTTKGHLSTAIGIKAVAEGDLSNAYGIAARSAGKNSNAFGTVSYAGGDESIAFGTAAETGNDANNSVALGYMSQVDGKNSAAVGQKNKVSKDNTFVLGNSVKGDLENSVYLGAGSTTKTSAARGSTQKFASATVGGVTYGSTLNEKDTVNGAGFAGHTPVGIVSVGSVDDKGKISARRIQNVAAGAISETSTDAINGSQLYAVLPKYTDDGKGNATSVTIGDKTYNLGGSADGNDNTVTELTVNGGNAPDNKTGNLKLTDTGKNGNHKYDVSLNDQVDLTDAGSLKVGGDKDGSPVTNVTAGNIDFGDQQGSVTNVASHLAPVDSTYNAGSDYTTSAPGNVLNTPVAVETARNNNDPVLSQAATVGDVINAGWNLQTNGQALDFVTHADTVNFKSSDNTIKVTGKYTDGNISEIDLSANIEFQKDGKTAQNGDTADAVKLGDKTYKLGNADGNDNTVTELTVNGGNAPENKTGNLKLTDKGKNGNHQYDVSLNDQVDLTDAGSLKVGGDKDGSPVTNVTAGNIDFGDQQGSVTNVKGHLGNVDSTYNAGNDHTLTAPTASLAGDGGTLDTPIAVEKFRNSNNPALNEAATLGDVLNAGWELRANGQEVDFITHADAINFKSSDNSISVAGEYDANNISNIDLKANVKLLKDGAEAKDGDTANAIKVGDNTYNLGDGGDANWNLTVDGGNATTAGGKRNLKDSNTIDVAQTGNDILFNVKTTPLTVNNGVVGKPAAPNSLVTAGDVQTAINNSGWFVNSGAVAGRGTNSGAAKTLVKAGEEVKFIAGDGMNIVQNGKEFTFNAKIVDSNGKQLTVDKDGNYVVSIVDPKGKPVTINSDGQYVVDGGSGNGNPFTITADDGSGKPSTTTIDGVEKTPGAGVAFVGDENTSVTKQETPNGTNVQVGLNDVVNVGGKPDANNPNKPVTIDGEQGNITFNGDKPVTVSNQDGNLSVGDTKVVNMKPGENPTDGVNVSQLLDTVGAASSSPATDKDGKPIGNVVKTTDKDGNEYTLKTYNVNGQGEYLTNNVVEAVSKMNEQGIKFFHVNDGNQQPVAQAKNEVDSQAFGKNAVAIGVGSIAKGENSIAIGTGNEVNGKNSGAFGDPSIINGNNSYSVGNNNTVATDNTFVLGNKVTNTAANSVFLGDESGQDAAGAGATGTVSSAKVGDIEYDGFAGASSNGMVSVGNATQVRRVSGVAAGQISASSTDAINGSQLHSALKNSGVYVTSNGAAPTDANLVKLGNKAGALNFVDGKGTTARVEGNKVTFDIVPGYAEGIEAGENVEFGYKPVVDQDGKPLYVDGKGGTTTDPNAAQKDADGNPIQQQTTVINAKQPDLRPLEQQVQQVENNSYAGVAQAMATAGLPQAYLPGKSMVAVAGGYYKGESGYALGVSTISDSGNWVFKATASGNSRNNYGGTVGAGYQW